MGPALHIDAARAMQYTKEIVAFGPRWDTSKPIEQVRAYIKGKLKGARCSKILLSPETSAGKMPMTNIVAKFPGSKDGIMFSARTTEQITGFAIRPFVGANDGADHQRDSARHR